MISPCCQRDSTCQILMNCPRLCRGDPRRPWAGVGRLLTMLPASGWRAILGHRAFVARTPLWACSPCALSLAFYSQWRWPFSFIAAVLSSDAERITGGFTSWLRALALQRGCRGGGVLP